MANVKKQTRLSKAARELNVGISTIVEYLGKRGVEIDSNPNTKISPEHYELLSKEFGSDHDLKEKSKQIQIQNSLRPKKESVSINDIDGEESQEETKEPKPEKDREIILKDNTTEASKTEPKEDFIDIKADQDIEIKVVGKIDLQKKAKEEAKQKDKEDKPKAKAEPQKKPQKKEPKVETEPAKEVKKAESEDKPKEKAPKAKKEASVKKEPVKKVETKPKKAESAPIDAVKEEKTEKPKEKVSEEKEELKPETEKTGSEDSVKEISNKVEIEDRVKVIGKIDLDSLNQRTRPPKKTKKQKEEERKSREKQRKDGPDQAGGKKGGGPDAKGGAQSADAKKKKRKRIKKDKEKVDVNDKVIKDQQRKDGRRRPEAKKPVKKKRPVRAEVSEVDVQKQVKDTLARLTSKQKSKGAKHRREKRSMVSQREMEKMEQMAQEKNTIKVTEFISVSELATMMEVSATDVISTCMNLGLFVSINQRLDAETMALVADEYNYKVEFVSAEVQEAIKEDEDKPEDLEDRSPIVTVMGHVDHGKTSLLDHIRKTNVIAGEAGGITQHIGAYNVALEDGRKITFLDTPGHEAFTAMRARGAQVTDVAIIIVAADDSVMPQTVEAINHASAAGVPIVFAINKIDRPSANPEKIKEQLAAMNYMVEAWGGKYQSQDISAKAGQGIEELLEKVLLEAELLDLKANPNKVSTGTVIESSLDKGRGYVSTILVENGTMRVGDVILAGSYFGHVKAMYNERGNRVQEAGPATPVLILGLNGAPQAGDKFNTMESDKEAKDIANKREQLQREQGLRTQKHITLDEIGRRIAIGNFQELNVIVKGDVDGSIEALSDSLIKLSTEEIQVNIIHKGVGQISETDIMLAAASNAIIVGFQVRPSISARRIAEKEEIDIRLYSIIYDAINEIKDAMEGMLSPEIKEEVVATIEIRETFKITKVGTIAGCMVKDGKINRNHKIRLIRDGIVIYSGELGSLKRFKDDVKEVATGYECGLNITNFNDIKVGDIVEAYEQVEVKKKL